MKRSLHRILTSAAISWSRMPVPVLLLLVLASSANASPQSPNDQPLSGIFGRVVDAETHRAVRRAAIKVYTSKMEVNELTDSEGRFRFPDLATGDYYLIAHRDGYTDRAYQVERSDFSEQKELPVELRPQGVVTGRVVGAFGQGLESAVIEALVQKKTTDQASVIASAETDDLGAYRLSGLNPGTYRLRATYREGRSSEFNPTPLRVATSWFGPPGTPSDVTIKSGSLITGINFTLDPVQGATVRGRLRTEAGILRESATLWIMGKAGEGGHNGNAEEGEFAIADVAPGTYTISAETLNQTTPLFGIATVQVPGSDVQAVDILLSPVPQVDAEVRVIAGSLPDLENGSIYFIKADQFTALSMQMGHPDKDGKFTVSLIPGEYSINFDAPIIRAGIRSVTLDDKPCTNWKLQIDGSPRAKKLVIVLGGKPAL